ncbi:MAG: MFS transporter [Anaerolineae bacterium]|nr:MFS transporter [Anaerolineae bacterium]
MTLTTAARAQSQTHISRLSVVSWVLYDLANTVFSLNIVSLYFSLWVVNVMGGTDQSYGNANGLSMLLMFFSAPLLGALSDQAPRRLPFLVVTTLLCIGFTLLLGIGGLALSLVCFIIANYFYQAGLIFYDSLLPEVSTVENRGKIGGIGVGVGYLGSFIGLGAGILLLQVYQQPYPVVFRVTGLLFLLFALPAFLFIRERPRRVPPFNASALGRTFAALGQTLQRARRYPGLLRFLIASILYADGANTVIAFMGIYVSNELGFTALQTQLVLVVGIAAAMLGGFGGGFIVDRLGPKRVLMGDIVVWMLLFALAAAIPLLKLPSALFWLVAALAGFALGCLWSADRPLMLRLSPPRYLGQFYGLYSMVGRFASVIGPIMWGFIVNTLNWGRPAAILSLLILMIGAFVLLLPVPGGVHRWGPEDLPERA